jgi:chaperonin GroES
MSDVLSQAAAPQVPSNAMPALPDEFMPRRPNLPEGQLGEPKLEEPPDRERQPLLRPELVESIADRIARKNLAEGMEITERELLASTAKREYKIDDDTRAEWKTKYRDWLDFALQIGKPKNYPWQNASNVIFPLITVAALQFNARAYPAVVMGRDVVKGSVEGDDRGIAAVDPQTQQPMIDPQTKQPHWIIPPGSKQHRADNIGRHMSWQLLTEMPEWEEQTDRLLIAIAICGCMFRKSYYDPARRHNVSETVSALRVVVNYHARSFEDAARVSEEIDFYPWEIETNIRSGLWLDYDGEGWTAYGRNTEGANLRSEDDQAPITFIEQHRRYDLDGDGYDEPIIVTFARDSGRLARITVGFDEDSVEATSDGDIQAITPVRFYTKFGFIPNPDDSPYDIGFGNLLYPLNDAINTSLNQMFDAGHLANAGGGFIGAGASLNSGSIRFMTGEYKVVNTPGRTLRENLVPLEFPGPNQVLFQLLEFLVAAAKEIASINDVLSGEIPGANVPGILGLAVIQQGLKVFNAVFKRVHRALRSEYEKLFRLNRLYLPDMAGFRMGSQYFQITRADYALGGGVEPVSDPEMVTDVQQMAQANFLAQFMGDPTFDQREIRLRMLQAACIQQIDKILAPQSPPNGEMLAKMAELDLAQQQVATQKQLVELRAKELEIRALHQEAELAIRRGKDKALEIKDLSAAILNLANAKKADHEVDQDWYALQLTNLRHQIDLLNTITVPTGEDDTGSAVAAIAAPTLSQLRGTPAPGAAGGGVPGV